MKRLVQTFALWALLGVAYSASGEWLNQNLTNNAPHAIGTALLSDLGTLLSTGTVGAGGYRNVGNGWSSNWGTNWHLVVWTNSGSAGNVSLINWHGPVQAATGSSPDKQFNLVWTDSLLPALVTNCYVTQPITNTSPLYEVLVVSYRQGSGPVQGYSVNVAPYSTHTFQGSASGTNCPITLAWYWQDLGASNSVASTNAFMTNSAPSQALVTNSPVGDRIPVIAPLATNVPSPVTLPTQSPRTTNYVDAATATRTLDANSDARARELAGLMVQQSQAQRQEAAALQETAAAAADQAHRDASNMVNAVAGLGTALTNTPGAGGSATNAIGVALPGGTSNTLFALAGNPGTIGKVAPVVTIPLHALNSGLEDKSLNFADASTTYGTGNLASWAATIRTFLLFVVTLSFLVASFKMVGKAVWS